MSEENFPPSPAAGVSGGHVNELLALLGGRPVLLPIAAGAKGPRYAGWQEMTWERTQDAATVLRVPEKAMPLEPGATAEGEVWRTRRYADLLPAGNIGVLQGEPSVLEEEGRTWRLCSIDIDDAAAVDEFLALNPKLAGSLRTAGHRGCNVWVWVEGEMPRLHKGICWIATEDKESVKCPGKKIHRGGADLDRPYGEWRSTGGQTVIWGRHPQGCDYRFVVKAAPARVAFAEIVWPAGLWLPWAPPAPPPPQKGPLDDLIAEHGDPWTKTDKGNLVLNQAFFAAFYAKKHRIIYSPEELRFYRYQGAASGLWKEQTADNIRWEFAADIKQVSDEQEEKRLINMRTTQLLNALVAMLRGSVERWRAFERPISPKTNRARALVHLQNGMLDLDESPPVLRDFSAEFMSRNQLAVALDEEAKCPRFLGELLGKAVKAEEIGLLQKFAGQMLLGVNLAQKLLILTGTAGGGKSTLVNILCEIIGRVNVGQLRTEHLHERFELFRMMNKTLLIGVDVPGNFLMSDGAYVIKGLTGGDLMDAEPKTSNQCFQIKGEFNVVITCNSRLRVRLDGDGDAWRRRLAIVNYEMKKPDKPDPHFVQRLMKEESAGILNWMIEGALLLLKDLAETGGIVMTGAQKDRVESLLAESDSVRDFVRRGCARGAKDHKVTSEQLLHAYVAYCEARGWTALPSRSFSTQLPDVLLEIHGATACNDIKGEDGKSKRGYRGIEILESGDDDSLAAMAPAGASTHEGARGGQPAWAEDEQGGPYDA